MNKKRIKQIADIIHLSSSYAELPLRISIVSNMSGVTLNRESFIELMEILETSVNIQTDLNKFGQDVFSREEERYKNEHKLA